MLALQRTAGNRAAAQLARRSLEPPGPVGEITAGVEAFGFVTHNEAVAVRELVLGSAAAGFEGYATEQEAAIAASSSTRVGVVVADGDGRFHAYETDLEPIWGPLFSNVIPFELPEGRIVRWTHLRTHGARTWQEQLDYALQLSRHRTEAGRTKAVRAHLEVLTGAVGLQPTDVHDSTNGEPLPGKVSFDLDHVDSRAHAGVAGAIPSDRTTPLPAPTLEVGPLAFGDLVSLRGTLLHEFEHVRHAQLAIDAIERWRATEPRLEFRPWLDRRLKSGKLDAVDHAIIREQVTEHGQTTESLSYLRAFMATYHLRDLTEVTDEITLFSSIFHLAEQWYRAGHAVQDDVIARLVGYRDGTLDAPHRERLDRYAAAQKTASAGTPSAYFWERLPFGG